MEFIESYEKAIAGAIVLALVAPILFFLLRDSAKSISVGRVKIEGKDPPHQGSHIVDILIEARSISEIDRELFFAQRKLTKQKLRSFRAIVARSYKELFVSRGYQADVLVRSLLYRMLVCHSSEMRADIMRMIMNDIEQNHLATIGDGRAIDYYISGKVSSIIQAIHESIENDLYIPPRSPIQVKDVMESYTRLNQTIDQTFRGLYNELIEKAKTSERERNYAAEALTTRLVSQGVIKPYQEEQVLRYLLGVR
jgi:hypothetical protein